MNRHQAEGTEVLEELETITLQPIGRGVHDLEPLASSTIPRSTRVTTPLECSDSWRRVARLCQHFTQAKTWTGSFIID
ncbi:unnamed protein product [Protopolystoma xenopodis]|uniref:Uncharacterized protein n=1 Tax=Protopolystoma xenopodis TaxID=117903 RepID=A0A448XGM8_9PLAT|nr:unnamed protein product [Protopolystoma xenopodis]